MLSLTPFAVRLVRWCCDHAALVAWMALVASVGLGFYAATHLGIDTDDSKLIAADLPFRQAEKAFDRAFPQGVDVLVVVIDAATGDMADDAAQRLATALEDQPQMFKAVHRPAGEDFFRDHALLFLGADELRDLSDQLILAQPLIGALARDPSLRGLFETLDLFLQGAERGQTQSSDFTPVLARLADAAQAAAAHTAAPPLSWQGLLGGRTEAPRRFLMVQPVLRYGEMIAGRQASEALRATAARLGLTPAHGVTVRLTGAVALTDDNFATVAQGVELTTPLSVLAVGTFLFLAVRSGRVVGAIVLSLLAGLAATAAFAAATVHTLNPISVAFAVMFVGIAVDFAIQFSVRYRQEATRAPDPGAALAATAAAVAGPLTLAAAATAVGFFSFLPTAYTGVRQLGLIAGAGMLIALAVDLTLLPALLALSPPPRPPSTRGLPWGRAADRFLARHCRAVLGLCALAGLVGLGLLPLLDFDFNPLHLQDPKAESVATFHDLARDPDTSTYAADVLAPSLAEAQALARRFDAVAQVDHSLTLASFVPEHQDQSLATVADLDMILGPTLDPARPLPPPTPAQTEAAIRRLAEHLATPSATATSLRLAAALEGCLAAGPQGIERLNAALLTGLPQQLAQLRRMLSARQPVTLDSLPPDLARDWLAADGRARVQVFPKGDVLGDHQALADFVVAVQAVAPDATGVPVTVFESGKVVVVAFMRSGATALVGIGLMLAIMLRRALDVALVLLPLVLGGLYTVVACVALSLPINFANIIALPLLLGIGVAFNIYFVVNWRRGVAAPLASSTTRAVLFSALTTSAAFGTLALSPHPGTASMGALLFVSLTLSVLTTFVALPALFHLLNLSHLLKRPHP